MNKIYGIDLGTTNSVIAYNGKMLGEMVPSIVDMNTKRAGKKFREKFNTNRSFKVDMSCGEEGKIPVASSAIVLSELARMVKVVNNEYVKDVIISVPAFFSDNQRQATIRAAEAIGLNVRALINEPTAAAIYYNKNMRKVAVIYDLGGGTFDVSVVDSRLGNFDIQATDGIIVGGDNFDNNIAKFVLKRGKFKLHKFRQEDRLHLKHVCEQAKICMQKDRTDMHISLEEFGELCEEKSVSFTEQNYIDIMHETFAGTITEMKKVIAESLHYKDVFDLILVGGSTRCPYLREWITDSVGQEPVEVFYNPDLIVGLGASLYAKMVETGEAEEKVSDVTKPLSIGLSNGTVRNIIPKDSKIPITEKLLVTNPEDTDKLRIELYQGDSILAANNEGIGTLIYDYGKVMKTGESQLTITISVDTDGIITFKAKELLGKEKTIKLERK